MAEENAERFRRALDAFAGRDEDRWFELCDPEIELVPAGDWPEGEISGREAAWEFLLATDEPWEPSPYALSDTRESEDTLLARMRRDMRGKGSGVEVEYEYWVVATFRDGRALRIEWFDDGEAAERAAGLEG